MTNDILYKLWVLFGSFDYEKKSFVSLNCKISVRYKKIYIVQIYLYNTYIYLHCFAYFDTDF